MRLFLTTTLLIIGVLAASAQGVDPGARDKAVCSLNASQVTGVGALRLGMTPEQVLALFPGSGEDPEVRSSLSRPASPLGVSSFIIRPSKYQSKEKFAGIRQILFSLLDGHVSTFTLSYDGPEWSDVDKFVAKVIEGANLPPTEQWEAYPGMETQLKFLTCEDFEIRVFAGGQGGNLNYVLMNDLAAARTLKERRDKAREKARQGSQP